MTYLFDCKKEGGLKFNPRCLAEESISKGTADFSLCQPCRLAKDILRIRIVKNNPIPVDPQGLREVVILVNRYSGVPELNMDDLKKKLESHFEKMGLENFYWEGQASQAPDERTPGVVCIISAHNGCGRSLSDVSGIRKKGYSFHGERMVATSSYKGQGQKVVEASW